MIVDWTIGDTYQDPTWYGYVVMGNWNAGYTAPTPSAQTCLMMGGLSDGQAILMG